MPLHGNEDHHITTEQAKALIQNYRRHAGPNDHKCGFFGRAVLEQILAQPGCIGIRAYYARHEDGSNTLVLVGVDGAEKDMTAGTLAQNYQPCPPYCDPTSTFQL